MVTITGNIMVTFISIERKDFQCHEEFKNKDGWCSALYLQVCPLTDACFSGKLCAFTDLLVLSSNWTCGMSGGVLTFQAKPVGSEHRSSSAMYLFCQNHLYGVLFPNLWSLHELTKNGGLPWKNGGVAERQTSHKKSSFGPFFWVVFDFMVNWPNILSRESSAFLFNPYPAAKIGE